ncbi:multicopper oxidase family protein [Halodesulfurarchaeum formicicum]|nr:multicopper oxidase family protein [Halodesulfurarchaeum formicicum]
MSEQPSRTRRRLLQTLGAAGLGALAGCASLDGPSQDGDTPSITSKTPPADPADYEATVRAASGTVQPGGDLASETWVYNDQFPGPELRAKAGDVVAFELQNELPAETTIHWHGVPVANEMDGVPQVTQQPVAGGESFTYKFRAEPPGTYFYHSHVGLQLDRGLFGPLIIEESDPHVEYDREYTIVLDDYLTREPQPLFGEDSFGSGGMMGTQRPPYAGLLVNGRSAADPAVFDVREGERVRLRFINASSATLFQVQLGGHPMTVSHADGRPVDPVTVDGFQFGSGERYDTILEATNPGTWEIRATPLNGSEPPARAAITYDGVEPSSPVGPSQSNNLLSYGDLRARSPLSGVSGNPDRTFDLSLSPGGPSGQWLIDGQAYPEADPLQIRSGEHVRVRMTNQSPVPHPMHLHGHFFQVGDAVKDTVVVPGHMGQETFDFVADNPGDWLFHCHNLYHLEAGMARVIEYVD